MIMQKQINGDIREIVPRCSKMKWVRWNAMFQIWNECADAAVCIFCGEAYSTPGVDVLEPFEDRDS